MAFLWVLVIFHLYWPPSPIAFPPLLLLLCVLIAGPQVTSSRLSGWVLPMQAWAGDQREEWRTSLLWWRGFEMSTSTLPPEHQRAISPLTPLDLEVVTASQLSVPGGWKPVVNSLNIDHKFPFVKLSSTPHLSGLLFLLGPAWDMKLCRICNVPEDDSSLYFMGSEALSDTAERTLGLDLRCYKSCNSEERQGHRRKR